MKSLLVLLVVFGSVVATTGPVLADPPKPGSAEWNRRFREHERRIRGLRRKTGQPTSSTTSNSRTRDERDSKTADRPGGFFGEERALAAMSPSLRRIYDEASKPAPLDADGAPSADRCLLMFCDAINKGEEFPILLRCLAATHRKDYAMAKVHPNFVGHGKTDEEYFERWKRVVGHITRVDSVHEVAGVEGWVDVWAYVRAPELSYGLYRFRMEGEGRFYRLQGYRCDVIHLK